MIQELGEVADVTLLVGYEVCGNKDDTLVRQSIAPFGIVPEADVEMNALLFFTPNYVDPIDNQRGTGRSHNKGFGWNVWPVKEKEGW